MRRWTVGIMVLGAGALACAPVCHGQGVSHSISAGIHYWRSVDSISAANVEEGGIAYLLGYRYEPARLLKIEVDVEIFPEEYAGENEQVYSPQVYLVVGAVVYGGLGIGGYYADGELSSDVFYALRAGLDLELLPSIFLDLNANYRFENWGDIKDVEEDIDTDTVTLGAAVRLKF